MYVELFGAPTKPTPLQVRVYTLESAADYGFKPLNVLGLGPNLRVRVG